MCRLTAGVELRFPPDCRRVPQEVPKEVPTEVPQKTDPKGVLRLGVAPGRLFLNARHH